MKYKIIEILKTFSEKEIKHFAVFLQSPFFNESEKLRKLYCTLVRYYPDFDPLKLNEEKISYEINPNLPFNKSTLKTLLFELSNLAEDYLKICVFRNKKAESEDMLREEFFKRKLYKFADQNARKTLQEIDCENEYTSDYFYNRHRILTDICNFYRLNSQNSNPDHLINWGNMLCERAKCLSYLFSNELIIQYGTFQTIKKTFNIKEEDNFILNFFKKFNIEELLKFIISETDNESYAIIFKLQLANYNAFNNFDDEKKYLEYKNLLVKNIGKLSKDDIYTNFIRLIRYCMMKPDSESGMDFREELFSIYKFILSKKYYVITVHDYLPVELYRIVLKLGLELKKFKWTIEFIKKFNPKLNTDIRENMYNYSLAEYYFHKKRFDSAMRYFHKIELNHFMLRVDLKNLMLMTYYELDLYENAISLIDSYKHFLSNTEMLSNTEKLKCKYFIFAVQYMIRYKTSAKPFSKVEIEKVLSEDFHNKTWAKERFMMLDSRFIKSA